MVISNVIGSHNKKKQSSLHIVMWIKFVAYDFTIIDTILRSTF